MKKRKKHTYPKVRKSRKRRLNRLIVISGQRGTGKTTFAINLIKKVSKKRGTLIINPGNEAKWYGADIRKLNPKNGILDIVVPAGEIRQYVPSSVYRGKIRSDRRKNIMRVMEEFLIRKRSGLLVIDDARELTKGNEFQDVLESHLLAGRQHDIDVILIVHSLGQIPAPFIPYVTDLVIFSSTENSYRFDYKLPKYREVLLAQEQVNSLSKKNFHTYKWLEVV